MAQLIEFMPGVLVERDVLNIVEKIRAYDPNLEIQFLDPAKGADMYDAPYRIVEKCRDGFQRVVFTVWKLDETVLERIYQADSARSDILARLDANNARVRMEQNRRFREDIIGEAHDIAVHLLKNPSTTYSFHNTEGEVVKIEDDKGKRPREVRQYH